MSEQCAPAIGEQPGERVTRRSGRFDHAPSALRYCGRNSCHAQGEFAFDLSEKGHAMTSPRPAATDVALAIAAAAILGAAVGVLLTDVFAGVAVGATTAVVFRFLLRTIVTRK